MPHTDSQQHHSTPDPLSTYDPAARYGVYSVIVALFAGLLVISNVVAVKLIAFGPFTVDGGVFLFPLVYVLGNVLAEVYGFKGARRAILTGFVLSLIATATILVVQFSPPLDSWGFQQSYEEVLGFVPRIVAASMAGYLAGQFVNAWLLVRLRDLAPRRSGQSAKLWFRLIGSTAVGQLVDTVIFCTVAFFGVIIGWEFIGYVALGYTIKVLVEVVLLPVTTRVIVRVRERENFAAPGKP